MPEVHPSCRVPDYEAVVARLEERKARRNTLTAERLRELLSYSPSTGLFVCNVKLGHKAVRGSVAGYVHENGRRTIYVDGYKYRASRLAWLYVTGEWPTKLIDHRDLNPSNDKWDNLREASHAQNRWNARKHRNNRSGYKGVSYSYSTGKFVAFIRIRDKNHCIGACDTAEEAYRIYCKAAKEVHGEFARTE